jgi:hypothetical protein
MRVMGREATTPAALAVKQTSSDVLKKKTATARVKIQPITPAVSAARLRNAMRTKITMTGEMAKSTGNHDMG